MCEDRRRALRALQTKPGGPRLSGSCAGGVGVGPHPVHPLHPQLPHQDLHSGREGDGQEDPYEPEERAIEIFYDPRRWHSALVYLSPAEYEEGRTAGAVVA